MGKKNKYILDGFFTVSFGGGGKGFKNIIIHTDEKGMKEIEKDPLQDYLEFGVASINYVEFNVYRRTVIQKEKNRTITEEFNSPIKKIIKGKFDLTEKEEKIILQDSPVEITY